MSALLATFGLSMLLKNICLNRFSPNFRLLQDTLLGGKTLDLAGIIIPVPQLVIGIFALALLFVIYRLVNKTRTWLGDPGNGRWTRKPRN